MILKIILKKKTNPMLPSHFDGYPIGFKQINKELGVSCFFVNVFKCAFLMT